jgi:hypothetical protein
MLQREIAEHKAAILEFDPDAFRPRSTSEILADLRQQYGDEGVQYATAVMARLREPAKPGEQRESPFVEMLCGPEAERLFGAESVRRTREAMQHNAAEARRRATRNALHEVLRGQQRQRTRCIVGRSRPRGAGRPAAARSARRRVTAVRDGPDEPPAELAAARCPACGGALLFASGVEVCANRRCSRYGEAS